MINFMEKNTIKIMEKNTIKILAGLFCKDLCVYYVEYWYLDCIYLLCRILVS